jgi:uncharacterized integral membrane protein
MRPLILLLVLGGLCVFVVQNQTLISLVLLGNIITPKLPLGIWVLLFGTAGLFTTLVGQFLNRLLSSSTSARTYLDEPEPPQPRSPQRKKSPKTTNTTQQQTTRLQESLDSSDWESQSNPDWAKPDVNDDWDIENPPQEPTFTRPNFERNLTDTQSQSFEAKQEPKTSSRSGSVYSYRYRDDPESDSSKRDQIYDANYRVITPPYSQESQSTNNERTEDEDWI